MPELSRLALILGATCKDQQRQVAADRLINQWWRPRLGTQLALKQLLTAVFQGLKAPGGSKRLSQLT